MSAATSASASLAQAARLSWLDGIKGVAILWIAFFHFFETWATDRFPSPLGRDYLVRFLARCGPGTDWHFVRCVAKALFAGAAGLGFQGVGVFVLMSGFGLTYSLARAGRPQGGWAGWYRARIVRLYPMYWVAHLIFLLSPFVARFEPFDYRFLLSFLGDRIWPIDMIFYYANPAWWYFGLLIQLYLVYPVLFLTLRRFGAGWFLLACAGATLGSRYVLLEVLRANGYWVQGGFFACRLWEFALGMALGFKFRGDARAMESRLFSAWTLFAGALLYTAGLYTYSSSAFLYTFTDALVGTGLFVVLAHAVRWTGTVPRIEGALGQVGRYSYGLYLIHQPYVLFIGMRVRWMGMGEFSAMAAMVVAALALACGWLELGVNSLVERLLNRETRVAAPAA